MTTATVGEMLRGWRQTRRRSQLDLSIDVGVSTRHLSFVETGKARPSPELVLAVAEHLDVPLRERNTLLVAAGYAPRYRQTPLDDAAMTSVRTALGELIRAHDPYPALVVDRGWDVLLANQGAMRLLEGVADHLVGQPPGSRAGGRGDPGDGALSPSPRLGDEGARGSAGDPPVQPLNAYRVTLHPEGMARRIENLDEWAHHLLAQLHRQVALTRDPRLADLLTEVSSYPTVRDLDGSWRTRGEVPTVLVPLRLRTGDDDGALVQSWFSTNTSIGTPVDITLDELHVELFHPADEATAALVGGRTA